MTQATVTTQISPQVYVPKLAYQIAMPLPQTHLFEVKLTVSNWDGELLDVRMPVWTPGSYLVREYAKQVQDFVATSDKGRKLSVTKTAKNNWQILTSDSNKISISYRVFANELTVRTNH